MLFLIVFRRKDDNQGVTGSGFYLVFWTKIPHGLVIIDDHSCESFPMKVVRDVVIGYIVDHSCESFPMKVVRDVVVGYIVNHSC